MAIKNDLIMNIRALKLNEEIEFIYDNKKRLSYEYDGNHYLPMNIQPELIELGIEFEVVEYEFIEEEINMEDE